MPRVAESSRPATMLRSAAASEPSMVDCADAMFLFRGHPGGITVDIDDTVWVSDSLSGAIWHVASDGTPTPVLSPAVSRHLAGHGAAPLAPAGLALAPDGSLYVADSSGHRILAVMPGGSARVVSGGAAGYRDGPGTEALFRHPLDVAFAPDGACYVADTGNHRIRRIAPDGAVTTVAGSIYDYGDGRGPDARFRRPAALDVVADGTCYVADTGNNAIRRIQPDGTVTTLVGEPPGGDGDGTGRDIGLRWPTGIAVGADGTVWIADHGNGTVRRIAAWGESHTMLRLSGLRWPVGVALRSDDTLVVTGTALSDPGRPEACLLVVGGAR